MKNDTIDESQVLKAADRLLDGGVGKTVVIHFPEGAYGITRKGEKVFESSFQVEETEIVSTAGAGDAFCAGVLFGLHSGFPLRKCLKLGNGSARFILDGATCSGSAVSLEKIESFLESCPQKRRDQCCRKLEEEFGCK